MAVSRSRKVRYIMEGVLGGIVVLILAIVVFVIYFYVKIIQFFLVSVNLYKKMVTRQDATVKLLLDIRNNTKTYTALIDEDGLDEEASAQTADDFCYHCGAELTEQVDQCTKCGKKL